jgi:terminase, large subunit
MDHAELGYILAANPDLRIEFDRSARRGLVALEVPPAMRLSTWMERHFYLSEESSYEKGGWTFYPFQVAIADCIGHDGIEAVTWRKSARTGYTKIFLGAICYFAEHKHRNQAVYQPTDEDRDDFTTTELEPALRDVKCMRRVFPKINRKSKDNTMKKKRFIGCLLHLRGGKAAKNFRRITVDNVYYDETDGFDRDIEKEGSPFKLGDKRIEGATFPKSVAGSTPKLKGFSLIEDREAEADERFGYYVRCIHCAEEHTLEWGGKTTRSGFKWRDEDPSTVAHACPHCGALITQAEYLSNWQGRWKSESGLWIDESDSETLRFRQADGEEVAAPRHVAFFTWTAYSPQASWISIAADFMSAARKAKAGDDSDLKTFVNTTRGETYEVELEKTEARFLEQRAEPYALRVVPRGGVILTAGVDVQGDRWEIVVWAWGRGEESWVVDDMVIHGNPSDTREWESKLLPYLETAFKHTCGAPMKIEATAIDTGGHYTHQSYSFVRSNARHRFFAIKGDSADGKPVKGRSSLQDVNFRGKVIPRGVKLWMVGTDTAKDLLYGRFKVGQPGPGCVHFSHQLGPDFYKQLTAESRVPVKTHLGDRYRWIKPGGVRNEKLDCTIYAIFAAHALDLHRYTDKMWSRLEQAYEGDLFDAPDGSTSDSMLPIAPIAIIADAATPTRRSGAGPTSREW